MSDSSRVYDELNVSTVVNCAGPKTRYSGTLMREEAADAMRAAAESFVRISDLQARISRTIREVTGAEAGYVSTGAAAGLTLCAAACIAGQDVSVMSRLPETEGIANEILIPTSHRNSYDHALRAAGAKLVEVGNNDRSLGPGSSNLEAWEVTSAITEETVGVAFVPRDDINLEETFVFS